jgi:muramoyltetrapeptide carboxypeptidase
MRTHKKPPALHKGDTIGIVAPASNLKADMLNRGLQELEALGFKTLVRGDILEAGRYTAGSLSRRLEEFRSMLIDDKVRALFCARGGYGSGHLLSHLDPSEIRAHPKILCGSSDATMLLAAFQSAGVVAFHGPMVATSLRQGTLGYDQPLLLKLLVSGESVRFPTDGCRVLSLGEAEGRLAGGCLSLVVSTLGTPWEIDTVNAILILEDADCKPYQLDRMLTHLRQAGKLQGVRGIVFGEMLRSTQHPDQGYAIEDVILDVLQDLDVPILFGFPTGHTSRPHVIVPFGVSGRLSLGDDALFELLEPSVTL